MDPGGVQSAPFYFYFTSTIFIVGRKMNFEKEVVNLLLTVRNLKKMRRATRRRIKNEK